MCDQNRYRESDALSSIASLDHYKDLQDLNGLISLQVSSNATRPAYACTPDGRRSSFFRSNFLSHVASGRLTTSACDVIAFVLLSSLNAARRSIGVTQFPVHFQWLWWAWLNGVCSTIAMCLQLLAFSYA